MMEAADDAERVYEGVVTFRHKLAANAWAVRVEATGLVFEGMGETRGDALVSAARNITMMQPTPPPEPKHREGKRRGVPAEDFTHWLDAKERK